LVPGHGNQANMTHGRRNVKLPATTAAIQRPEAVWACGSKHACSNSCSRLMYTYHRPDVIRACMELSKVWGSVEYANAHDFQPLHLRACHCCHAGLTLQLQAALIPRRPASAGTSLSQMMAQRCQSSRRRSAAAASQGRQGQHGHQPQTCAMQ
jgi:hypothetical protein